MQVGRSCRGYGFDNRWTQQGRRGLARGTRSPWVIIARLSILHTPIHAKAPFYESLCRRIDVPYP